MGELMWAVIRQDANGNRYRVGRYGTREEAEAVVERFEPGDQGHVYLVERIDRSTP